MRKLLILGLVVVVAGAGWWWLSRPRPQEIVLTGTVDGNEVVVGAQVSGLITRMAVEDGEAVKAGQLIATLDPAVQQADERAASAAIAQADASQRQSEAQAALLSATLPTKVKQAEAEYAQAQAALQQADAQVKAAAAAYDKANANYSRIAPLVAKGVNSPLDLDNAKADLDSAAASRDAARAAAVAAARAATAAQATVRDAEDQQRQVGVQQQQTQSLAAAARQATANRQAAVARYDQTQIVAPVDGIITLRAARQGEVVNPGSPVVTIFQTNDTWVDADVEESYATDIAIGQTLRVKLASGAIVSGPVIYKAVEADFATQRDVSRTKRDIKTVAIRVRVSNPGGRLALGMTAWVTLPPMRA
jgi:HlyD family secretion protein